MFCEMPMLIVSTNEGKIRPYLHCANAEFSSYTKVGVGSVVLQALLEFEATVLYGIMSTR